MATIAIYIGRGKTTYVDEEDLNLLSGYRWCARQANGDRWYAMSYHQGRRLHMHRVLMGLENNDKRLVDHRDGNGLNNTRQNLRIATCADNTRNRKMDRRNTSGYRGVWVRGVRSDRYRAMIRCNRKYICLGTYDQIEDAARAYDAKAKELFGEFARLNFS